MELHHHPVFDGFTWKIESLITFTGGRMKMTDVKMANQRAGRERRDLKMADQVARRDNAGPNYMKILD